MLCVSNIVKTTVSYWYRYHCCGPMTAVGSADVLSGQSRFVSRLAHMGVTRLVFSIDADLGANATEAASGIALTRELQMAAFAMVLMCNPNIEYWQCFPVYSC